MVGEGGMKRGSEVGRWVCSLSDNPFSLFCLFLLLLLLLLLLSSSSSFLFRDIIDLTQQVNRLDLLLNQLSEQNEVLRSRLGLGPEEQVDLGEVREKRERERERMREENRLLQREVGKEGRWVGGKRG